MTFKQWIYRIVYIVRNKAFKRKVKIIRKTHFNPLPLNFSINIENRNTELRCNELLDNSFFTFPDYILSFDENIDWDHTIDDYRLINFKLNSFEWLIDLSDGYKISEDLKYIRKGFMLIDDWNNKCRAQIKGDKWNPYVVATRITNWIGFCSQYSKLVGKDLSIYSRFIKEQALELRSSLEYHLSANHLLIEAKSLVIAGCFLNDNDLKKHGINILRKEYNVQFLKDGGHYERSVSYHIESLQQYFETIYTLNYVGDKTYEIFIEQIKESYKYLNNMIGINGKIPLFNDSAQDYPFLEATDFLSTAGLIYEQAPPNGVIGEYCKRWNISKLNGKTIEWDNRELFIDTGYLHHKFEVKGIKHSLFIDMADCGPDSNLGHAHADSLQLLLCNQEKDIFVDSGVFTYKPGKERDDCRSTKAHNTIEIDGVSSAEIWGAFRVGKRGHSKILDYRSKNDEMEITGESDGYCTVLNSKVVHKRTVTEKYGNITIKDYLIGDSKTRHKGVSRFHLDDSCQIEYVNDYECLIDDYILFKSELPIKIEECYISKHFGKLINAKCIELFFDFIDDKTIETKILINIKEDN